MWQKLLIDFLVKALPTLRKWGEEIFKSIINKFKNKKEDKKDKGAIDEFKENPTRDNFDNLP